MNFLRLTIALVGLSLSLATAKAQSCHSMGDLDWEDAASWSCGAEPVGGDHIVIDAGETITVTTVNTISGSAVYLEIFGTLEFDNGKKLHLPTGSGVEVHVGGTISAAGPGGGSSNVISIGGVTEWQKGDGDLNGYALLGAIPTLPVELINFSAYVENQAVFLNWATSSEERNDFFTIQRSSDGVEWENIGNVNGAGTSSVPSYYSFEDENLGTGVIYYRLTQTDFGGESEELPIVSVTIESNNNGFNIYPNPVATGRNFEIVLESNNETSSFYSIHNLDGVLVQAGNLHSEEVRNSIDQFLAPGTYIITVTSNTESTTEKLIIL